MSWGAVLGLVAYLWLAPTGAMFFGPLALLLLVSRPGSAKDWLWIAITGAGLAVALQTGDSLLERTTRAGTLFFTGAMVVVTLLGVRTVVARVLSSGLIAAGATTLWYLSLRLQYAALRTSYVAVTWESLRAMFATLPPAPPALDGGLAIGSADATAQFAASVVNTGAELLPGELTLVAMLGGVIAWSWYVRIAGRPLAPAARPFREFRFNDHLIWVLVAAVGTSLFAGNGAMGIVAGNVAFVFGWLYLLRGLAVAWCALQLVPPHVRFVVFLLAVFLAPAALVISLGLPVVGVADTWLDLRRRLPPPSGVAA